MSITSPPNQTIRGDRAVYTVTNATVVLTGDVSS